MFNSWLSLLDDCPYHVSIKKKNIYLLLLLFVICYWLWLRLCIPYLTSTHTLIAPTRYRLYDKNEEKKNVFQIIVPASPHPFAIISSSVNPFLRRPSRQLLNFRLRTVLTFGFHAPLNFCRRRSGDRQRRECGRRTGIIFYAM